ncbi:HAMP domain-containing sensor histidine kinase [Tsukamurella sp. 8F]|uniref:sensor histidine kinase n=1 Tax=unclassified Tsukamurella TaxID=2633480 RepID=UPI0023B8E51A|nr:MULTISPECIES: HAMP domain-containing sensor histidine kinase [unclassified Tsukamurella]MDF0530951.1 HAMP domain-containing sensor histidine kinase [Tsukamurella sp. 8J]MDF0588276.1 HAMP domain-containing sensor histidine kinase [Tsukamurella sp. 8F]
MARAPGLSVRLRLTLSYAGFLMLAGTLLLAVVWVFLLRYVPEVIAVPNVARQQGTWPAAPPPFIPTRSDLQAAFVPKALWALVLLLLFGLVGGWILAGRMLAPLVRIRRATRLVMDGSLAHRIEMDGRNDEFRELADSFDAMLARLEAHVAEQERFAANASHELRTPLAITKTLLDVARSDPPHDSRELIERLFLVNTRAIELTEALLLLGRAERLSITREELDLSLIVEEAVETLLPLAEHRGLTIDTSGGVTPAVGSPTLVLQLTINLVHNAIVHNRPEAGSVRVDVRPDGTDAVLTVENTGPILDPRLVVTLTEPFQRGTGRIAGDQAGAGLGLAIVDRIVRTHDGTLSLTPGDGGGLHVSVRLPAGRRPS